MAIWVLQETKLHDCETPAGGTAIICSNISWVGSPFMGDEIRPHLEWTISLDFRIILLF